MLIECPECKGQVSDTAAFCPHCGNTRLINSRASDSKSSKKSKTAGEFPKMMILLGVPMTLLGVAVSILAGGFFMEIGGKGLGLIMFCWSMWRVVNLWRARLYEAYRMCYVAAIIGIFGPFVPFNHYLFPNLSDALLCGALGAVCIECVMVPLAIALNRNEAIHEWATKKMMKRFTFKLN